MSVMYEESQGDSEVRKTKKRRGFLVAAMRSCMRGLWSDFAYVVHHARLFVGVALVFVGLLSFSSDRYCANTSSSHFACAEPSVYYFYSGWMIASVIVGSFLVLLWWLRQKM